MAGIYIHIPFCKSRCVYCGFYSTTGLSLRQRYAEAIISEMQMRCRQSPVSTIYLGGGTPSQLTISQLNQLLDALYIYNKVEENAEITIECNPDDVTEEFAAGLKELPVNRVSMGAQTFNDDRLQFLHRRHTAAQVVTAVKRLRQADIQNISIDLMYGLPGETLDDFEADITHALALNVEHLSSYCLMIEEGTPLHKMPVHLCDEEHEREMYYRLLERMEEAGYEHYEISNFARKGYRSRHNSGYWNGTPYIGIGAAAHSYDIRSRSWNVSDIHQYIEGMEHGERIFEEELLDDNTRYNDTITVALRTCEGINLDSLTETYRNYCLKNARRFLDDGLLELSGHHLHLMRDALFVSDMVMSELIYI